MRILTSTSLHGLVLDNSRQQRGTLQLHVPLQQPEELPRRREEGFPSKSPCPECGLNGHWKLDCPKLIHDAILCIWGLSLEVQYVVHVTSVNSLLNSKERVGKDMTWKKPCDFVESSIVWQTTSQMCPGRSEPGPKPRIIHHCNDAEQVQIVDMFNQCSPRPSLSQLLNPNDGYR